jgi:hypothetical protein
MLNLLVETKNEYTTHLINILTPLIFEGLQSIYKEAQKIANHDNVLKIFQSFLKGVPKWNQSIIEKETNRIVNSSHSYGWLNDLIKATLKANLIVLIFNPTIKTQNKIDNSFYQNININDFIHKVYIECARDIWNNPYLLYHDYPPIEIKRNQRDCINIIKDCIREAIRKLLPVKHILQIYLGEEMELNNLDDNFEKAMTDAEEKNLSKLIKKDLENDNNLELKFNNNNNNLIPPLEQIDLKPKTIQSTSDDKTIGSKILNIINNNSVTSTDISLLIKEDSNITSSNSESNITSELEKLKKEQNNNHNKQETIDAKMQEINKLTKEQNIKQETIDAKMEEINKLTKQQNITEPETIDTKIKKILKNDLIMDTDLETSLNYSQEENDQKYLQIFSNMGATAPVQPNNNNNNNNNNNKNNNNNNNKNKKYFNNYLQF